MKKIAALVLVVCLLVGVMSTAGAAIYKDSLTATLLKGMSYSNTELAGANLRDVVCATMFLEFILVEGNTDILNELDMNGTCKIAAYGNNYMDAFYPLKDGTWLNMFIAPKTGAMTIFKPANYKTGLNQYTYYDVPASTMLTEMLDLVNNLTSDD